jgi:hypothetical protein
MWKWYECAILSVSAFSRTAPDIPMQIFVHASPALAFRRAPRKRSNPTLTTTVEKVVLAGQAVFSIASGALLICLERALTLELIRAMADLKPERVVCLADEVIE